MFLVTFHHWISKPHRMPGRNHLLLCTSGDWRTEQRRWWWTRRALRPPRQWAWRCSRNLCRLDKRHVRSLNFNQYKETDLNEEKLTYGRIILCGIVGLMRHREWEEVGVHAHFWVGLICCREKEVNKHSWQLEYQLCSKEQQQQNRKMFNCHTRKRTFSSFTFHLEFLTLLNIFLCSVTKSYDYFRFSLSCFHILPCTHLSSLPPCEIPQTLTRSSQCWRLSLTMTHHSKSPR